MFIISSVLWNRLKFGTMFRGRKVFFSYIIAILSLEGMEHCFGERCSLPQVSVYATGSIRWGGGLGRKAVAVQHFARHRLSTCSKLSL